MELTVKGRAPQYGFDSAASELGKTYLFMMEAMYCATADRCEKVKGVVN